jgi:hypothetical protein
VLSVRAQHELVEHARHVARDQRQPLAVGQRLLLEFAPFGDVGLGAEHAPRRAVDGAVDDAAALVQPVPAAVGAAGAVDVLVLFGQALRVAQVGGVVVGAVVRVDQQVPLVLGRREPVPGIAQHLEALVDVGQLVGLRPPLPDEGAGAAQRLAQQRAAAVGYVARACAQRGERGRGFHQRLERRRQRVVVGAGLEAQQADARRQLLQRQPPPAVAAPGGKCRVRR